MKADSKTKKRTKASAVPAAALFAGAVAETPPQPQLPDLEYVEQLLVDSAAVDEVASAPVATSDIEDAESTASVAETVMSEAHTVAETEHVDGTFVLPGQCLLRDAVECKQQLLQRMSVPVVTIDVSAVERIDTAYLQVLLSFVRSRASQQAAVTWMNISSAVVDAAKILGLHAALGLPELSEAA